MSAEAREGTMTDEQTLSDEYRRRIDQLMRCRDHLHPLASTEEREAVYEALADEVPTLIATLEALRPLRAAVLRYGRARAEWVRVGSWFDPYADQAHREIVASRAELDALALALAEEEGRG